MPVGEGKSLYYIAEALLTATRACVLTSSKGLQSQLISDFSAVGLTDMRGRNNYPCHISGCQSCEEGQHYRCECDGYEPARNKAMESPLVVTNYSYFMLSYLYGRGLGNFDLLICDEAHDCPDAICDAMTIEVTFQEANKINIRLPNTFELEDWHQWAQSTLDHAEETLDHLKQTAEADKLENGKVHPSTAKDLYFWNRAASKAKAILNTSGEWVIDRTDKGYSLVPVWARDYSKILFLSIKKIVLVSATMVRKTLDLLGIKNEEVDFYEYASSFPAMRSPVYIFAPKRSVAGRTGLLRIDHRTPHEFLTVWVNYIDNIIRNRLDRKGLIHTISYDRQQFILNNSEFGSIMIAPKGTKETLSAIEKFKLSPAPSILISPAITTGYDFPLTDAEYNILVKVPFVDTRSKIMQARQEEDDTYGNYITAQNIVQAHGRSMRSESDQSETFIVDGHMEWFIKVHRDLFPFWFHRLVKYPSGLPVPPAPLSLSAGQPQPQLTNK
jgi:Rad3-related DNA helicase